MKKRVDILGSTGSIGINSLDVIENNRDKFEINCIVCHRNIELLEQQINQFNPPVAIVVDEEKGKKLKKRLTTKKTEVLYGYRSIKKYACGSNSDIVLVGFSGIAGILPVIEAMENGADIALANKETMVVAGSLVMATAQKNKVKIIPVDSEHSAIFQCLQGNSKEYIRRILLTASGGPFRGRTKHQLKGITPKEALMHPKWKMGKKITIDSATLMNKGLEIIEAKWLFDLNINQIQVLIHPQSIIHSMVEYIDSSIVAQLGNPDMRIPIMYALSYPERLSGFTQYLDFTSVEALTFEEPDIDTFECLKLAVESLKIGGTMPVVLNAANEIAVELFLNKEIEFLQISEIVNLEMSKHKPIFNPSLMEILNVDKGIREKYNKCSYVCDFS